MKAELIAAGLVALFAVSAFAQDLPNFPKQPTAAESAALAAQGAKPGDDALTCEQIGTEMQPYAQAMMPSATALGQTAQEMQALQEKQKAAAMAQAPLSIGAGIASSFLPGGGFIAQAQAANQAAQAQQRAAEAKPLRDKMLSQSADLATQVAPMQQEPRFQRLMQLAETKCQNMQR